MDPLRLLHRSSLLAALSFAILPALRGAEAPERNLLKNANFESGTGGWKLVNFGKGGKMALDRMELHNGKATLRIEAVGELTFVEQTVKVKPHTTYLLSGYIKVKDVHEAGGAGVAGGVVMMGQSEYGSQGIYGTADWQKVTTQLNTEGKTEIRVGPAVGWWACKISGTGWFSDLSLTELDENKERGGGSGEGSPGNLVANGNFGKGTYGWELINFGKEGTMEMDPAELHDGKPALRVECTETMTFARQVVTVKPHTNYRLSGFVKVKDVHENGGAGDAGADLIVGSTQIKTQAAKGTADWQELSIDFNSEGKSAVRVGPALGFYGRKISGTAWFSEMSLLEVGGLKQAR
jgi:hypothetical protein